MNASFVSRLLFNWGFQRKLHFLNAGKSQRRASPFFDALVFSKIKQRLGGQTKLVISGGAPLAAHVEDFLRVTMCCPVGQGYGLTETNAASFITVPDNPFYAGSVGLCLGGVEFKLVGVPEMNYDPLASPPRGELCLRGPTVFTGYYKQVEPRCSVRCLLCDAPCMYCAACWRGGRLPACPPRSPSFSGGRDAPPSPPTHPLPPSHLVCPRPPPLRAQAELTAECMDEDGWFHTGDIGELRGDSMRIMDRKKNIFKLAQGEYVAAEKIEGVLGNSAAVDQLWIYG